MNESLEPLPKDIVARLSALVPPPAPHLAASLLASIHAHGAATAGAPAGAAVAPLTKAAWWTAHVPLWVPLATLLVGAGGGAVVQQWTSRYSTVPVPPLVAEVEHAAAASPEPEVSPAPPAVAPPVTSVSPIQPRVSPGDALRAERLLVDGARSTLKSDPAASLKSLDAHARRFPTGQLKEEREALAVQALLRLNRTAQAQARFQQFARDYPQSALVQALAPSFSQ